MPISVGSRTINNVRLALDLGLVCPIEEWDSVPEAQQNELTLLRLNVFQHYGPGGSFGRYWANIQAGSLRNFPTMHFLHLYEEVLGWAETGRQKHITVTTIRKSYTAADIENMSNSTTTRMLNAGGRNNGDSLQENLVFRVVEISRGADAIEKIARNTQALANCTTLTNTALACIIDSRHKLVVMRNHSDGVYEIITNRPIDAFWHRLLPTLLLSEAQLQEVGEVPYDQDTPASRMRTFCRMLYENRVDEYIAYMHHCVNNLTGEMQRQLYRKLDAITSTLSSNQEQKLNATLSEIDRKIEDYYRAIQDYAERRANAHQQLTGLLLNKEEEAAQLTSAFEFIKKHPEVTELKNVDTSNSTIMLIIKTPIGNWRIKDAEMWFKRKEENYVNRDPKVAAAFKACFVDETFEMLTETMVKFAIKPNVNSNIATGGNLWGSTPQEMLQNVHVGRYNCFANYRSAIQKAVQAQDYSQCLMLLIQACATYTFTDSTVVASLCNNMGMCPGKTYREKATGNLYTLDELYKKLHNSSTVPNTVEPEPLF